MINVGDWVVGTMNVKGKGPDSQEWTYPGRVRAVVGEMVIYSIVNEALMEQDFEVHRHIKDVRPAMKNDFDRQILDIQAEIIKMEEAISVLYGAQKEVKGF